MRVRQAFLANELIHAEVEILALRLRQFIGGRCGGRFVALAFFSAAREDDDREIPTQRHKASAERRDCCICIGWEVLTRMNQEE